MICAATRNSHNLNKLQLSTIVRANDNRKLRPVLADDLNLIEDFSFDNVCRPTACKLDALLWRSGSHSCSLIYVACCFADSS